MKSAAVAAKFRRVGQLFNALTILNLVGYQWPKPACVKDGASFDFIIVGGGTAGCVIANRLIEQDKFSVLVIEAGDFPPYETKLPGLILYLKNTQVDWNFTSSCNVISKSSNKNTALEMTQGKVIGGTGSINYMGYERGNKYDYDRWAKLTNNSCWSWKSVLPTILKNEMVMDNLILNSSSRCFYGTKGKLKIMKQYFERNEDYFSAFEELGWHSKLDVNPTQPLGFTNVMYNIGDNERQSTARKFLSPIKDNPKLHVMTNTLATKIIFDDHKRAIGVEVVTKDNKVLTLKANKEVIVSSGALKSPQILMLSGIGPKEHLKSHGIKCLVDLPVGKNFQDHVNSHLVYKLTKAKRGSSLKDPHKYPYTVFDGYVALNKTQKYPDYEPVGLSFGETDKFFEFCAIYFNFDKKFCDKLGKYIASRELLLILVTYLYPKSRGEILLASTNPFDHPIIIPGYYNEPEDIVNHANYLKDFNRVLETSYFKKVNAELVMPVLKSCDKYKVGSQEHWECYTVAMADTAYYYMGTCGMGPVLDSRLRVHGVKGLRVIDASSFPDTVGATFQATVIMVAQKGVEFIIEEHSCK